MYGVLKEKNLNLKQLQEIYTNEQLTDHVICRDSARIFKTIFDKLGYESKIIDFKLEQEDIYELPDKQKIGIRHTTITVKGDNDKNIFMTINNDLPDIQMGMKTSLFGNHMTYIDPKTGKPLYEGEEVESYVIPEEEILKYDIELGYATRFSDINGKPNYGYINTSLAELRKIAQDINKNSELISKNPDNSFYMELIKKMNQASGSTLTESFDVTFSNITESSWEEIKKFVFDSIIKQIKKIYNIELEEFNSHDYCLNLNRVRELLIENQTQNPYDRSLGYEAFIGQGINIIKNIDLLKTADFNHCSKELLSIRNKFITSTNRIIKFFVNPELIMPNNYMYSNEYIINKLKIVGPQIFQYGTKTTILEMGIAEKITIIDEILDNIFYELKNDKTMSVKDNFQKGFKNRVYTASLYNKENGKYDYLLYIKSTDLDPDKVLIFDFEKNNIIGFDEPISLIQFRLPTSKYILVSNYLSTLSVEQDNIKK